MKRALLSALLLLVSGVARGQTDDLTPILKAPTKACADGAVSAACKCGGTKVTTGFCCSGVAQAYSCPVFAEDAGAVTHVTFTGSALADSKSACQWAMVGTVPQNAASGVFPPSGGNFSDANYYQCDPNGNGNDPLDFSGAFTCAVFGNVYLAANHTPLSNSNIATNGWFSYFLSRMQFTAYDPAAHTVATTAYPLANRTMVFVFGRDGSGVLWSSFNLDAPVTTAGGTPTPATTAHARIGRAEGAGASWAQKIYEVYCTSTAPTTATIKALQVPAMSLSKATNFMALGDSITFGYNATTNWPTVAQNLAPSTWNALNRGVFGLTTAGALTDWTSYARGLPATFVGELLGVNDAINSVSSSTATSNLQTIYDQALADGQKLVLVTVLPFKAYTGWTAGKETIRQAINTFKVNYAAAHPGQVILLDEATAIDDGTTTCSATACSGGACCGADGLHLTTAGETKVGTDFYNAVHAAGWW